MKNGFTDKDICLKIYMPMNLSFFAEGGEKTEEPTAKKKNKARSEGQVAKSQELGIAVLFIFVFMGLRVFAGYMIDSMKSLFYYCLTSLNEAGGMMNTAYISKYIAFMFLQAILIAMPIMLISMIIGVIINFIQVGWHPTTKPLKPKFSKISPLAGAKRIFSPRALMELVKAFAKFAVILLGIYIVLADKYHLIMNFIYMDLVEAMTLVGEVCIDLGMMVGYMYIAIAAVDLFYQIFKHKKNLKMSKQEVKEEYKEQEGDPHIKGKIRGKMREMSMRQMMNELPSADVIITNPTHYAVALKYDRDKDVAPIVVAKGVDFMAKRIREKAAEHDIVIMENKPLARSLYASVDIGEMIPPELYAAVSEILVYVYKLKKIA